MNIDQLDLKQLSSLLSVSSKVSSIELPALLIGIAAAIPGFLDESILGLGAVAVFGVIVILRHFIKIRKTEILERIDREHAIGNLTHEKHSEMTKALNILTVPGGENHH